ncbi:MAG: M20 family metallo-hydrolase [Deltaproteobacteria bacterium]|nr:M20 family metallo-hydrolase [Deltaproteobacteria bacterium]
MTGLKSIFKRIEGYREEVISLQTGLTARKALGPANGGTGEHEKTDYIRTVIQEMNPDVLEIIQAPDSRVPDGYRPNLIAKWGEELEGATVWVLSHSDIVPPGDLSLWDTDPYTVKVDGDRIIGRGVEDNQHGFVSSWLALKGILESEESLSRPVGLAVVADEETGSEYGLHYLLKHRKDLFREQDLIVVPDAGNEEGTMIEIAEKSMLWLQFTIIGKQCHASTPHKGKNSLVGAATLILALQELDRLFSYADDLFSPPESTFSPTRMDPNVPNINTIPGKAVFCLDCRILPRYQTEEVFSACREVADKIGSELDLKIEMETIQRQEAPTPTPIDSPVVLALQRAIKLVTGRDGEPMGIGGGTVAAFFRKYGLPAAVWSTCADTAHQPNESCLIPDILTDAKVFAALYLDDEKRG